MDSEDAKIKFDKAKDEGDSFLQSAKETAKDWKDSAKDTLHEAGQKIKDVTK